MGGGRKKKKEGGRGREGLQTRVLEGERLQGGEETGEGEAAHLEGQQLLHRDVEDDVHVWGAPGGKSKEGCESQAEAPELRVGEPALRGSPALWNSGPHLWSPIPKLNL